MLNLLNFDSTLTQKTYVFYFYTYMLRLQPLDEALYGVVAACVRLLGAWTAEETETLLSKYVKILPHLVTLW